MFRGVQHYYGRGSAHDLADQKDQQGARTKFGQSEFRGHEFWSNKLIFPSKW